MKKIKILSVLVLTMLLLVSCRSNGAQSSSTTTEQARMIDIMENGELKYALVIAENASPSEKKAASSLADKIGDKYSIFVSVKKDSESESTNEILIGNTCRTPKADLEKDEIYITATENKIIIKAENDSVILSAAEIFWQQLAVNDQGATFSSDLNIKQKSEDKEMTVKIATYNIKISGEMVNHDYSILAKDILDSGAEIVALQEVDNNTSRNGNQDTVKELLKHTGWKYSYFGDAIPRLGGFYGNAIISKYPIISAEHEYLPQEHSSSQRRCVINAKIDVNGLTFNCFVTHCQQKEIVVQLNKIYEIAKSHTPYVVMGDYNWSDYSTFESIFKDASLLMNNSNKRPTTLDNYSFDNMIISNGIEYGKMSVINTGHSDHYMLTCEITLKNN